MSMLACLERWDYPQRPIGPYFYILLFIGFIKLQC